MSGEGVPDQEAQPQARGQVPLLLSSVLLVFLGQMTLNPIIAPLSREVGLAEWQIGATISAAAMMFVLTSQFWGRRSQSWGRKPVLVMAFGIATLTTTLFALVAQLGMAGLLTGTWLFILFVLLRGVVFGGAAAAVPPTAQAYIADITTDEAARVKGMAGVGAMQGIAMVLGAVLGGVLATLGLLVPLLVIPLLFATGLLLLVFRLRRQPPSELVEDPARVSPFDTRIWPFLLTGLGMFTALGFVQVITGFLVQDRLGLDGRMTGLVTGGALLSAGIGMVIAQALIVPRSRWLPPRLLRVGSLIALVGFAVLIPEAGLAPLLIAIFLIGLGLGIASPGYTAGSTLLVGREEQGGLAGLIGATNGLTFVIAPSLATALYGLSGQLPVIIGASLMALVAAFVFLHPRFRRTDDFRATVVRDIDHPPTPTIH